MEHMSVGPSSEARLHVTKVTLVGLLSQHAPELSEIMYINLSPLPYFLFRIYFQN